MIFNEIFFENRQQPNSKLFVCDAGILCRDKKYIIERENSETNVIGYIKSGLLHVNIYNKTYQIHTANTIILPHHTKYKVYSDPKMPCTMLWLNIRGSLFNSILESLFENNTFILSNIHVENIFNKIKGKIEESKDNLAIIMKMVTSLLIDVSDKVIRPNNFEYELKTKNTNLSMERYILGRIPFGFNVTDMAGHFHISTSQLNRTFKKAFSITPYQYYLKIRIDLAKSLLINSELSIDEISTRLYFSNRNNFTARFTSLIGIPPAKYRETKYR